jgi:hypothetical protein
MKRREESGASYKCDICAQILSLGNQENDSQNKHVELFLGKLILAQIVKEFPVFYGTEAPLTNSQKSVREL